MVVVVVVGRVVMRIAAVMVVGPWRAVCVRVCGLCVRVVKEGGRRGGVSVGEVMMMMMLSMLTSNTMPQTPPTQQRRRHIYHRH